MLFTIKDSRETKPYHNRDAEKKDVMSLMRVPFDQRVIRMTWMQEIYKVGLINWLRRDEFSHKLESNRYYPDIQRLSRDRDGAHRIDLALGV